MRVSIIRFLAGIAIYMSFSSAEVFASCTSIGEVTIPPPPGGVFDIPADRWEAGMLISGISRTAEFTPFECSGQSDVNYFVTSQLPDSGVDWTLSGMNFDVFETGVPGVGYAFAVRVAQTGQWVPVRRGKVKLPGDYDAGGAVVIELSVWYVSTGQPVTGSHSIPDKVALKLSVAPVIGNCLAVFCADSYASVSGTNLDLTVLGCELVDSQTNVDLGAVPASKYFRGVGSVSAPTRFSIPITCNGPVAVDIVPSTASAEEASLGVVKLTRGGASGVGIQLLQADGETPIPLGESMRVLPSTLEGANSVGLAARYYQTADKVIPGHAAGMLQFTLKYR